MSGFSDRSYIDTFEDKKFRGFTLNDGESVWTRPFDLRGYGTNGVQGLYIDCTGSGTMEIVYQTDPGREEGGEDIQKGYVHDWFESSYRNPLRTEQPMVKDAIPMVIVIGRFVRFKITASGGAVDFNSLKLCYE